MYITIEGLDGSFKSTVAKKLNDKLLLSGVNSICVRQPGGTPKAEELRDVVKAKCKDEKLTVFSETMLFLAARSQLTDGIIAPAINKGEVVISDRCNLSTIAYQSLKGMTEDYLTQLIVNAPWFIKADLTIIIDIPHRIAGRRILERGEGTDHLEQRLDHCEKVFNSYNASKISSECIRLSGVNSDGIEATSDQLAELAYEHVLKRLKQRK